MMEANLTTSIIKHTSLRILRSERSPPDVIRGLVHETIESTTFKCAIHKLDSLIQEDIVDTTQQIKSLRFRQLSYPPPSLPYISTLITPSSTVHMYSFVWKVEFSCPLDVRWVFHVLVPLLPKLSFLRFGVGCFEEFYYDYMNEELNQYYVQLLALNYAKNPSACYPDVRELHISVDERKLSDFNYPFQALITSVNLILDFSIKYLKNSLTKTNFNIPANCALDSFLNVFPKIKSKGQRIENYEKNITRFCTTSNSTTNSSSSAVDINNGRYPQQPAPDPRMVVRTPSMEYSPSSTESNNKVNSTSSTTMIRQQQQQQLPQMKLKRTASEIFEAESTAGITLLPPLPSAPPTGFYVDRNVNNETHHQAPSQPPVVIYDVPSSSSSDDDDVIEDPRKAKLRIVDTKKILVNDDDDDNVCSSTTPLIQPPPKPAPMEKMAKDIMTSIAEESSSEFESSSSLSSSSSSDRSSSRKSAKRRKVTVTPKRQQRSRSPSPSPSQSSRSSSSEYSSGRRRSYTNGKRQKKKEVVTAPRRSSNDSSSHSGSGRSSSRRTSVASSNKGKIGRRQSSLDDDLNQREKSPLHKYNYSSKNSDTESRKDKNSGGGRNSPSLIPSNNKKNSNAGTKSMAELERLFMRK